MKLFSWSRFYLSCIFFVLFTGFFLIDLEGLLSAAEESATMETTTPDNMSATYFRLVDSQILDDQMLERISPALIAPLPVEISRNDYDQIVRQEYNNAICFKRCHSRNDFSVSDNTEKQWRLLIEADGHAIFNTIPWENSQTKEKIVMYLINNAGNYGPETEGIGIWH